MALVDYEKAHALLNKYDIRSVESGYVKSAKEAVNFSKGNPIVLKAISQNALHKTKNKLVALNLSSQKEVISRYNDLERKAAKFKPYKILAQRMVNDGTEIIIGGNTDRQFGKMILIGLGGIYVEIFKDFALRLCPITRKDAESMLNQLRSARIMAPDPKASRMVIELLLKVSDMFVHSDISELDLNPVILHDGTYDAVDLRMIK